MGGADKCNVNSSSFDPSWQHYPCGSFGKPGWAGGAALSKPTMQALYLKQNASNSACTFQLDLAFQNTLAADFGAPQRAMLELAVSPGSVRSTLRIFNKTATRRPEALWLRHSVPGAQQLQINKLGAACSGCDSGT